MDNKKYVFDKFNLFQVKRRKMYNTSFVSEARILGTVDMFIWHGKFLKF